MKRVVTVCLVAITGVFLFTCFHPPKATYWNTKLSFEERAADLVSQMTLEEKVSQLRNF